MNFRQLLYSVFAAFVVLILSMVYLSINQKDIHLVSKDYYKEEIAYETTIAAIKRTPEDAVSFLTEGKNLIVSFNSEKMAEVWANGEPIKVEVKRNEDDALDLAETVNSLNTQQIPLSRAGKWKVRASWTHQGKLYLTQTEVYL